MPKDFSWDELEFWRSPEWQYLQEQLDILDKTKCLYNPEREVLFKALDETPYHLTKVVLLGQDPYPSHELATGLAFSIPGSIPGNKWPVTLIEIFKEYRRDLDYPLPSSGDLSEWAQQGVLLWNCIPTVQAGSPLSHWYRYPEWKLLTKEILESLNDRGIVVVSLGAKAREFMKYVDDDRNEVIELSHPSPRGSLNSRTPFKNSRIFSTINDRLGKFGREPIDWRG